MGGRTPDRNWNSFFRPVTPETSIFSQATMGATSPLSGQANVAPMIEGVPVQGELPQAAATPTMASAPPPALPAAPVDYLKAAHQRSTNWMNAQGNSIAQPMAGAVQAGTSFRNRFGTGSVVSAESQNRLNRMMRRASAGLPRMFDEV